RPLVVLRVVRQVEEADAVVERLLVEALDAGHLERVLRGVDEVPGDGVPVLLVDRDDVVLQPGVVRLHLHGAPALGARLLPLVPVGRQRLERDERVVRGAAAEDAGAAVPDVRVAAWLLGGGVVVVELTAEQAHPAAQRQHVVPADVAGAALDDGDGDVRVLGESRGDDGTRGPAAYDDVVVDRCVHGGTPGHEAPRRGAGNCAISPHGAAPTRRRGTAGTRRPQPRNHRTGAGARFWYTCFVSRY